MGRRDQTEDKREIGGEDYGEWYSVGDTSSTSGASFSGYDKSSAESKSVRSDAEEESGGWIMVGWRNRQHIRRKERSQGKGSRQDHSGTDKEGGRNGGSGRTKQ